MDCLVAVWIHGNFWISQRKTNKNKKTHKNKSECVRRVCGTSFVIALVYKNHSIFSLYFLDVFSFNQIPKICWRILTLIIISQYWKSDHWLNLMTFFLGSWSESLLLNVKQHFFFLIDHHLFPRHYSESFVDYDSVCWLMRWEAIFGLLGLIHCLPGLFSFFLLLQDTSLPLSASPFFSDFYVSYVIIYHT